MVADFRSSHKCNYVLEVKRHFGIGKICVNGKWHVSVIWQLMCYSVLTAMFILESQYNAAFGDPSKNHFMTRLSS